MLTRLPPAPFLTVYGVSSFDLLKGDLSELELKDFDQVMLWATRAAEVSLPELREPTIPLRLFEPEAQKLVLLGVGLPDIRKIAPTYNPAELEEAASLLVAQALIRRQGEQASVPVASSAEVETIARERGWRTLKEPLRTLNLYKEELTAKGRPVLLDYQEQLGVWNSAKDDGSFISGLESVQKRLDLIAENKALFSDTLVTPELVARGKTLVKEAKLFLRGREGREIPKQKLTLARDQSFTLLLPRIERLRDILRAVYFGQVEMKLIDGEYFRRLAKISKARKPRQATKKASSSPKVFKPKPDPVYLGTTSD